MNSKDCDSEHFIGMQAKIRGVLGRLGSLSAYCTCSHELVLLACGLDLGTSCLDLDTSSTRRSTRVTLGCRSAGRLSLRPGK